jgi:hypothetical protein
VGEIGFSPERNNRYAYFVGATVNLTRRSARLEQPTAGGVDTGIEFDSFKYKDATVFPLTMNIVPGVICTGSTVPGLGSSYTQANTPIWTGAAQGQVDNDPGLDNWSISTGNRILAGTCDQAGPNPSGQPANEWNDVNHST